METVQMYTAPSVEPQENANHQKPRLLIPGVIVGILGLTLVLLIAFLAIKPKAEEKKVNSANLPTQIKSQISLYNPTIEKLPDYVTPALPKPTIAIQQTKSLPLERETASASIPTATPVPTRTPTIVPIPTTSKQNTNTVTSSREYYMQYYLQNNKQ